MSEMKVTTDKPKEKIHVTRSLMTVLILPVILLILILSACNMYNPTYEQGAVDPPPALGSSSAQEPAPESSAEPIPEQAPESIPEEQITEAEISGAAVTVDGVQTHLLVYEIDELIIVDLFEIAYVLTATDKEFLPAWDEENEALHLTSESPYYAAELDFLHVTADSLVVSPVDFDIFLDGSEVAISAYSIGGGIFFNLYDKQGITF